MIYQSKLHRSSDAADTRLKIVRAAADEFAAQGFRASTVQNIASTAKVNEITVYRHFPQKQALYWEAIAYRLRSSTFAEALSEPLPNAAQPEKVIQQLTERLWKSLKADAGLTRIIYFTILELDLETRELRDKHFAPLLNELALRIQCWIDEGKIRSVDPQSAALTVMSVILSHWNLTLLLGQEIGNERPTKLAADFVDICLGGLVVHTTK